MFRLIIIVLFLSVVCFGQAYFVDSCSYATGIIYSAESVSNEIAPVLIDEVWSKDQHLVAERIKKYRKEIMRSLTLQALKANKKFIEAEARRFEKGDK